MTKRYIFSAPIEKVDDEIAKMLTSIFGKQKKNREGKDFVYYPLFSMAGNDVRGLTVKVIVRKVNNTSTCVVFDYDEKGYLTAVVPPMMAEKYTNLILRFIGEVKDNMSA